MDTQSKMVKEFSSIKEQSQLLVKETSGRLGKDFIYLLFFLLNKLECCNLTITVITFT